MGLEFLAEPGQNPLFGWGYLNVSFTRDLHVAKSKIIFQSLISLKGSLLDLTRKFESVHPSPLLGFLDGTLLVSPPLF